MQKIFFFICFILLLCIHLSAEENPYNIKNYDLLIQPDFNNKTLYLSAKILIDNPFLEKEFYFGLNDYYDSVDVKSDLSQLSVERTRGVIAVTLKEPTKVFTLTFNLLGKPGMSLDVKREVIEDSSLFLLWSDRFYPIDFDHWAIVKTHLILPDNFKVIAPGLLKESKSAGDNTEFIFETTQPAVCFSVFADSRWIRTEREINGIKMHTLLHPECQKYSEQIFTTSSEILKFYSDTYCQYPFDQFSFITISDLDARRAFSGFIGYSPAYLEKEFTTTGHDAHETALLWWCYTLRGNGPGSFQWTEGFGDYAEILYDEKFNKPVPKIFQFFREKYLSVPKEEDLLYHELRGNTPQAKLHGKYPWLMHVLRFRIGDEAFNNAMKLLFEKFKFRTFSIQEFINVLEEGAGQSILWWVEEWLERRGVPEIRMIYRVTEKNGLYSLSVLVEQIGEIYILPLEIGIKTFSGIRIEKINLSEKLMEYKFESTERPDSILLDPNDWILMKKIYEITKIN